MTTNKIKLTWKQYEHLKSILSDYKTRKPRKDGVVNVYKYQECQITIYRNKATKKLGFVIQGQVPKVHRVKNSLCKTLAINDSSSFEKKVPGGFELASAKAESDSSELPDLTKKDYVGCDEVGVGDFFGPVVTCAVFLTVEAQNYLNQTELQDSKRLTNQMVLQLADQIRGKVRHEITTIIPLAYNKLIEQGTNANAIKALSHNQSISTLFWDNHLPENTPIVMDQFVEKKYYENHLRAFQSKHHSNLKITIPTVFTTGAEALYPAVAAASVLARADFLKWHQRFSKKLKVILPLGATPNIVNSTAVEIAQKHGLGALDKVVKKHFKNYKSVLYDLKHS